MQEFSKCPLTDMFLMLPSISRWQWHPYSIMGSRDNGDGRTSTLTLAVQNTGDWTQVQRPGHLCLGCVLRAL